MSPTWFFNPVHHDVVVGLVVPLGLQDDDHVVHLLPADRVQRRQTGE